MRTSAPQEVESLPMSRERAASRSIDDREPASPEAGLWRATLIVFLVSLSLLNAQVSVTRLLAYRFFYHFVFFVISLSQLGLAVAGAWIYASRRMAWYRHDLERWLLG